MFLVWAANCEVEKLSKICKIDPTMPNKNIVTVRLFRIAISIRRVPFGLFLYKTISRKRCLNTGTGRKIHNNIAPTIGQCIGNGRIRCAWSRQSPRGVRVQGMNVSRIYKFGAASIQVPLGWWAAAINDLIRYQLSEKQSPNRHTHSIV